MAQPVAALSRFQATQFQNPSYVTSFWSQHSGNFESFVIELLTLTTLQRLLGSAKEFAVKYAFQFEITKEEIKENIEVFVTSLEKKLLESERREQEAKNEIVRLFRSYFQTIQSGSGIESMENLKQHFKTVTLNKDLEDIIKNSLGSKYEDSKCRKNLLPFLLLVIARFLDVYDNSVQGKPIAQLKQDIAQQQQDQHINQAKQDPQALKNVWQSFAKSAPSGPAQPFDYAKNKESKESDLEASNPQIEEEIVGLGEAYENARLDFSALYNYKGEEFKTKWTSLTHEERKEHINRNRESVSHLAQMGLMYCPELNAEDVAKNNGQSLIDMMEGCKEWTNDISKLDTFTSSISLEMKKRGIFNNRTLMTIIYSRKWVICSFCVHMIMDVLQLGAENESENNSENSTSQNQSPVELDKVADLAMEHLMKAFPDTVLKSQAKQNPLQVSQKKQCSNPTCPNTGQQVTDLKVCGNCKKEGKNTPYCSRTCQQQHWPQHKTICTSKT